MLACALASGDNAHPVKNRTSPMTPILIILTVAVLAGLLAGGSLRTFERVRVHLWGLAVVGLALQMAPVPDVRSMDPDVVAALMLLVSYAVLLSFAAVNRKLPGAPLILAGLALNLVVIAPNGGMPVDAAVLQRAGAETVTIAGDAKHHLMSDDDVLPFLGDTIAVPEPAGLIVSIGDVELYVGLLWFVVMTMLGQARENVRPPARWFQMYRGKHLPPERRRLPRRYLAHLPAAATRWGTVP
jgi:hypothetical protein